MSDQEPEQDLSSTDLIPREQLELLRQFVKVQGDELEIRRKELDVSHQQQTDAHEYSKLVLTAQAEELRHGRESFYEDRKKQYILFGGVGVVLATIILVAFFMGKSDAAMELIKLCAIIGGPSLGAYAYGKSKGLRNTNDRDQD